MKIQRCGGVRGRFAGVLFASLLLASGLSRAQDSAVVYYRELIYQYPGTDECAIGPVYADNPTAVAEFVNAKNNEISTCDPVFTCKDPTTLVSVTDTTYTVASTCNGAQFTHPIRKIINPKQDPQSCCVSNPVNPSYGAKYQEERDYTSAGDLKLVRYYDSAADTEGVSGVGASFRSSLAPAAPQLHTTRRSPAVPTARCSPSRKYPAYGSLTQMRLRPWWTFSIYPTS